MDKGRPLGQPEQQVQKIAMHLCPEGMYRAITPKYLMAEFAVGGNTFTTPPSS